MTTLLERKLCAEALSDRRGCLGGPPLGCRTVKRLYRLFYQPATQDLLRAATKKRKTNRKRTQFVASKWRRTCLFVSRSTFRYGLRQWCKLRAGEGGTASENSRLHVFPCPRWSLGLFKFPIKIPVPIANPCTWPIPQPLHWSTVVGSSSPSLIPAPKCWHQRPADWLCHSYNGVR